MLICGFSKWLVSFAGSGVGVYCVVGVWHQLGHSAHGTTQEAAEAQAQRCPLPDCWRGMWREVSVVFVWGSCCAGEGSAKGSAWCAHITLDDSRGTQACNLLVATI